MNVADTGRRLETYLCAKLLALVPSGRFLPMHGIGDNGTDLEPPFSVVTATDTEKLVRQAPVWACTGSVQVVTHQAEATSEEHAGMVRDIYEALVNLPAEETVDFTFSGIDVVKIRPATDSDNQAYVDAIDFTAGVVG